MITNDDNFYTGSPNFLCYIRSILLFNGIGITLKRHDHC